MYRITSRFVIVLLVLFVGQFCLADTSADSVARRILDETKVTGGLIVHLGCGDGLLTTALRVDQKYLVQGLDTNAENVARARSNIERLGKYGPVSVGRYDGVHLPYIGNLVDLIVVEDPADVPESEIMRVLAPRGVAHVKTQDGWTTTVKPWPEEIDEWTHFMHGPDNNAVASDRVVGPPSRLQWLADPIHLRSHEHLNSVSALVSAAGRIFYIIDEGPTSSVAAPPKWRLVARDAFNGLLLWKRDIGPWEGHFRVFRSGPPDVARRLVAVGDRVYATLGYGKRVAAFDAATGELLQEYEGTDGALEILCDDGKLHVLVGEIDLTPLPDPAKRYYPPPAPRRKGIVVLDAYSGEIQWQRRDEDTTETLPTAFVVSDGKVFIQNTTHIICMDAATGTERWSVERPVFTTRLSWSAPTLVVKDGVVLSADGSTGGLAAANRRRGGSEVEWVMSDQDIRKHPVGDLVALSAEDGSELWTGRSLQGFCNPGDLFVIDGQVWCGADVASRQAMLNRVVDLKTGELLHTRPNNGMPVGGHTRCYRSKATEKYLVLGDIGVEFVELDDWDWNANPWVRGTCQYGVMPCNGLLYVPPDSCACRPEMRLHGFSATAPRGNQPRGEVEPTVPLVRGPAYAEFQGQATAFGGADNDGWPTYRHDIARSGRTDAAVPAQLRPLWKTEIGEKLSSITVAGGKVFVACPDAHRVVAIDAGTGEASWSRTVGGRVDSPPTVFAGMAVFGCRDGHVYCVRASDGELIWRFRAAPDPRRMVAMERVESVWPVHGSVLVRDGQVWFAAGRSPFLDGGIHVYALDAFSGAVVAKKNVISRGPQEFDESRSRKPANLTAPNMPDILSASDDLVFMRWMAFDRQANITKVQPHLFSATGFLDDTWWHRTYWQYGTWMNGGFGGWPRAARRVPSGRIMVGGGDTLFTFARSKYDSGNGGNVSAGHVGVVKRDYQDSGLVAPDKNSLSLMATTKPDPTGRGRWHKADSVKWRGSIPILARAMLLADRTLFVAGPDAGEDNSGLANLRSAQPGAILAVSSADGQVIAKQDLPAAPVFDGMAAAGNRLYVSTMDGTIHCFGANE